ncbi:MAG: UDP-N-acetyl-D-glucosamine 2-epimerase, UDP-hydrolysing [Candidatus Yanofskybacteria bacterium RIFCSPHIGHO2_02_FULL_41_11]|uniref:UDP-N-acetyl-D-glucosamine 2-epimerase, UDP-hydrolysing n=1 Tax=Candidatus Yanofskybacteria bacterium RIFCSPHIGHO2_02_FULL_41_11 TaxID=1802675 RepID=A0A1F8FBV6_9BACT|nr:MAG: UDP-N-acetyl-D-glucosamine 2-epimerase, UDP-hydrolysing [Candidatus Yanofskybacteria bacterium RIFCSPHIGHO2_02_FULL_41_11]
MAKKNILIITGSRSTYGLWRPIIKEMLKSKLLAPKILVTGMHTLKKFGYTVNEVRKDKFPIASVVKILESDDMLRHLIKEIAGIRKYCLSNKVDGIFVLGDTDHMLAGAIVAGHLNIPLFHIAGGDLSGFVVDSAIRHAITKFSNIHFAATKNGAKRVAMMGEEKWRIFNVGAPGMVDLSKIKFLSKKDLAKNLGLNSSKKWTIVLQHATPLDKVAFIGQIQPLLKVVSCLDGEKIVIYPNSDTGSDIIVKEIDKYSSKKDFHIFKTLPRKAYLNLFKTADLLVGNSSSGIVESTFFKIPTIDVGNRQNDRERGENVIHCDYDGKSIKTALAKVESKSFQKLYKKARSPYGNGTMDKLVVKITEQVISRKDLLFKKHFARLT